MRELPVIVTAVLKLEVVDEASYADVFADLIVHVEEILRAGTILPGRLAITVGDPDMAIGS